MPIMFTRIVKCKSERKLDMVKVWGKGGKNESSQAHMCNANMKIRETWEDIKE